MPDENKARTQGSLWWNHKFHRWVRDKKTSTASILAALGEGQWGEAEGENKSLMTLRAVVASVTYKASWLDLLVDAIDKGLVPEGPLHLWAHAWRRNQFWKALHDDYRLSPEEAAALGVKRSKVLGHWPWLAYFETANQREYQNPLAQAVRSGDAEAMENLAALNRATEGTLFKEGDVAAAIETALRRGDTKVLDEMAALGFRPQEARIDSLNALCHACRKGNATAVAWLLDKCPQLSLDLDPWGQTPAMVAIQYLSTNRYDPRSNSFVPVEPEVFQQRLEQCGKILSLLNAAGVDLYAIVPKPSKTKKVQGEPPRPRRKQGAAKPGEDLWAALERRMEKGLLPKYVRSQLEKTVMSSTISAHEAPAGRRRM